MITPTAFVLLTRGVDSISLLPLAYVAVESIDHKRRITIYKLTKREGHWYNIGQFISLGYFRPTPEKNGKRLSDCKLHQSLITCAEE